MAYDLKFSILSDFSWILIYYFIVFYQSGLTTSFTTDINLFHAIIMNYVKTTSFEHNNILCYMKNIIINSATADTYTCTSGFGILT